MKKTSLFYVFLIGGLLIVSSCNANKPSEETTSSTSTTEEEQYPLEDVYHRIKALPNVISVSGVAGKIYDNYSKLYTIRYNQLIDHKDPSKGTFSQKIELGYRGLDNPTVLVTEGYDTDSNYTYYSDSSSPQNELAHLLTGNYVYVEHRYFGDSKIDYGMDYKKGDGWEYLTTEQAAADLHSIVTDLRKILTGKWLSSGASKGGMTTELYAYYYPHDIDVYVPRVAPFANSFFDTRMYEYVFTQIGNKTYGEEKAQEYRTMVTDFMIKLLEYRDDFTARQIKESSNTYLTDLVSKEYLYDVSVLELPIGEWQYYHNFSSIKKCLDMSDDNLSAKKNAFYSLYKSMSSFYDLAIGGTYQPYFIQSYQELGNYGYDLSYVKNRIQETGSTAQFVITDEQALTAYKDAVFNSEMMNKIKEKELVGPKINQFLESTDCDMILIYGDADPWYAIRPDDVTNNPHIKIYVNEKLPHSAGVSNFDSKTRTEILNYIHSLID